MREEIHIHHNPNTGVMMMDSNMDEDDDSQTLEMHPTTSKTTNGVGGGVGGRSTNFDGGLEEQQYDREAWKTLNKCFRQVQSVLDHNRVLIQLVNENHQSQLPHKLLKNVALIREINANITKVASLYSDLSLNFSNLIRKTTDSSTNKDKNNDGGVQLNNHNQFEET